MTATVKRLDHVNLRTADLDAMVAWYGRVLGLTPGPRPGFGFPGAWLYADGHPILHLVGTAEPAGNGGSDDLKLEHFAVSATGLESLLATLEAEGARYQPRLIEDFGILQVNVWDPDGNHLHIDFDAAEAAGMDI